MVLHIKLYKSRKVGLVKYNYFVRFAALSYGLYIASTRSMKIVEHRYS